MAVDRYLPSLGPQGKAAKQSLLTHHRTSKSLHSTVYCPKHKSTRGKIGNSTPQLNAFWRPEAQSPPCPGHALLCGLLGRVVAGRPQG